MITANEIKENTIKANEQSFYNLVNKTMETVQSGQGFIFVSKERQRQHIKIKGVKDEFTNKFIFMIELDYIQSLFMKYISSENMIEDVKKFYNVFFQMDKGNFKLLCLVLLEPKGQEIFKLLCLVTNEHYFIINLIKKNRNQTDKSFFENMSEYKFSYMIFLAMKEFLNFQNPKTLETSIKSDIWPLIYIPIRSLNILKLLNLAILILKEISQQDIFNKDDKIILDSKNSNNILLNQYPIKKFDETDLLTLFTKLAQIVLTKPKNEETYEEQKQFEDFKNQIIQIIQIIQIKKSDSRLFRKLIQTMILVRPKKFLKEKDKNDIKRNLSLINQIMQIVLNSEIITVEPEKHNKEIQDVINIKNNPNENKFIVKIHLNQIENLLIKHIMANNKKNYYIKVHNNTSNVNMLKEDFQFLCIFKNNCLIIKFLKKNESQTDKSLLKRISGHKIYKLILSSITTYLECEHPQEMSTEVKINLLKLSYCSIYHNICKLLNLIIRICKNLYPTDNIKLKKYEDMLKLYENMFKDYGVIHPNIQKLFAKLNECPVKNFDENDFLVLVEKLAETIELIQPQIQRNGIRERHNSN